MGLCAKTVDYKTLYACKPDQPVGRSRVKPADLSQLVAVSLERDRRGRSSQISDHFFTTFADLAAVRDCASQRMFAKSINYVVVELPESMGT